MGEKKIEEITILRGIAFLLVIIGHSYPDSAYEYINDYTQFFHDYIYSFHMPLFFIISGFCMKPLLDKEQLDLKYEIGKRCKRLLIPYLLFSYIAIIPKLISGAFMYLLFEKKQLWEILLGKSPSGTLWYVWTLLTINIVFIIFSKLTKNLHILIVLSTLLYGMYLLFPNGYFNRLLKYPLWFTVGILLAIHWNRIYQVIKNKGILMIFLLILNGVIVKLTLRIGGEEIISSLLGSVVMLYLAIKITEKHDVIYNFLRIMSIYSYGIYLLSPYVQVAIRVFLYRKLNAPYAICMVLMIILGISIPYLFIKYVIKKSRILSGIMLGEW